MRNNRHFQPPHAGLPPIVIAGPSGVGKGMLINLLLEKFPDTIGFSVSHTTRGPREGEVDGVTNHFTQKDQKSKICILDIDIQGVQQVKASGIGRVRRHPRQQ
ncbi:hypothetical protein PF010_g31890, partial [Phytophthora fragariae]